MSDSHHEFSDELDQREPAKSARFPTGTRVCVEFKNSTTLARTSRKPPRTRPAPPTTAAHTHHYTSTPPRASSATRSRANSPRSPILIMPNYFLPPAHSLNNIYIIDAFARSSDRRLRRTTTAYANLSGGRHTPRTCPQRPPDYTFVYSSGTGHRGLGREPPHRSVIYAHLH